MANEANIITLLGNQGDPVEITVSATTAVPKGTIMCIDSSPQTGTAADTDGDLIIGITQVEKTATDGVTKLMCVTHCLADIHSTSGMTLMQPQKIEAANSVTDANDSTVENSREVVGISLETVGAAGTGAVLVNIG